MSGRDRILGKLKRSLGRDGLDVNAVAAVERRLASRKPNLVPKRAERPHAEQVDLFIEKATSLDISVARVGGLADVPGAIADYLAEHNLPSEIKMSPDAALDGVPWAERPMLKIARGRAEISDAVGVTPAFRAIAETGTLVTVSSAERPATLNFVPDDHVVVLKASQVVGTMEDMWAGLRNDRGDGDMPRTVNMISGPSRTADIQLTLIKGAHGPRRLHIVLVDDGAA